MEKQREINSRTIRIKLADGTKINGYVNINRESGYDRLSDLVATADESILIVFNAQIYEVDWDNPIKMQTIFVNKRHIIWATPGDD